VSHVPWNLDRQDGLHWFEMRLDGEYYTRIPLRIRYEVEAQDPDLPVGTHRAPTKKTMN